MKQIFLLLFSTLLFFSCTTTKSIVNSTITSEGGDGSSYEKAIIIKEKTETSGVAAEYKWLSVHYPNCKTTKQSLSQNNNKPYDIMTLKCDDGNEINVYFDISNFFGKF